MKKKTKGYKQRLNNLLIVLLLSAMLLVMSTYAWFTANKTVNVDNIDVKVSTSSGLQISADGVDWKTVLTKADIENALDNGYTLARNQLPKEMAPVSTDMTISTLGTLNMYFGDVYADLNPDSTTYGEYVLESELVSTGVDGTGKTISLEEDGTEGKYIAFDVFLKSGSVAKDLYMSGNVIELKENGVDADGNTLYDEVTRQTDESGISYATRVGVIRGENTDSSASPATIRNLRTTNGSTVLWEPNYDCHTANGVANAIGLGWFTSTDIAEGAENQYLNYDALNQAFTAPAELSSLRTGFGAADKVTRMTPTGISKRGEVANVAFPKDTAAGNALDSGITKLRIYMWVEGQDVDAENYAAGTFVEYSVSFSLDPFLANP